MKRMVGVLTVAIAALALLCQSADAGGRGHRIDKRVKAAAVVTGAAATVTFLSLNDWRWFSDWNTSRSNGLTTGGAYALTSVGCIAIAPMVATAFVRRPLTHREAHVLAGGCVVPIIGGWLVNAAYNANPHWDRFDAPPAPRRRR
jgi:hypothetical protein